jgi:predicted site-specific integrase-resolvase
MGRAHGRLLRWDEIRTEYGVPRSTLASWVRRGHLAHFATAGRSHLYLEADVLRCLLLRESGDSSEGTVAAA